jgi:hypothetical protein
MFGDNWERYQYTPLLRNPGDGKPLYAKVKLMMSYEEHAIEIINGDIFRLKKDGSAKKEEILKLRESKTCPTCGQLLDEKHQIHITDSIKAIEEQMYEIANQIKTKDAVERLTHTNLTIAYKNDVEKVNSEIVSESLSMEKMLNEIGVLTNDKNDVEKRKEIVSKIEKIPFQIENESLKIDVINRKIDQYNQSLIQIEENKKFEKTIDAAKEKLKLLKASEDEYKNDVTSKKMQIQQNKSKIIELKNLIIEFEEQEKRDNLIATYKKCVHRDGIPKQMLVNYIIPKVNEKLKVSLANVPFIVWLDSASVKLKFAYNNNMDAAIDAISSSGKERTFAALSLKSALNEINAKSKPSMFLMDELTGKLDDFSVEEFIEFIHLIKSRMKKVMIVEYKHEINPDYIITVIKDEDGLSHLEIE